MQQVKELKLLNETLKTQDKRMKEELQQYELKHRATKNDLQRKE